MGDDWQIARQGAAAMMTCLEAQFYVAHELQRISGEVGHSVWLAGIDSVYVEGDHASIYLLLSDPRAEPHMQGLLAVTVAAYELRGLEDRNALLLALLPDAAPPAGATKH
jgi:hypothetical protein